MCTPGCLVVLKAPPGLGLLVKSAFHCCLLTVERWAKISFWLSLPNEKTRACHTHSVHSSIGGGLDPCLRKQVALYAEVCDEVVPVGSAEVAEAAKLF